jgi:TolA-binding protein
MSCRWMILALFVPALLGAQQTPEPAPEDDLQKADALVAEGKSSEAMALYRSWLEASPSSPSFGAVLLRAAAAAPETGTALALLREYGPRVTDAGQRDECLGRQLTLLSLLGRSEEALALEQARPPTPSGRFDQALLAYELGELGQAERLASGVAQEGALDPEVAARAQHLLAVIFIETGRYSQAEAAFRTLAERYADAAIGPAVLLARRDFELARGNRTGADAAAQELCRRYPAAPECLLLSRTGSGARVRLAPTPARLLSGLQIPALPAPETQSADRVSERSGDDRVSERSGADRVSERPSADRVSERPSADRAIIQTGSFRDEENASYMVRDLKAKGFEARVMEAVIRDVRYYRVVVGSQQSTAQAMLIRLKEAGFEGVLILPD